MISREDKVEQSVQDYVRARLVAHGYVEPDVELLDAFPYNRFEGELDKNYAALGFNFDDQGAPAELGSDLKVRIYTIEFFVFGTSAVWGRNLANVIKFACEHDSFVPLKDIGVSDATIGTLEVIGVNSERVPVREPRPWEENVFLTRVKVEDTYSASLTG